MEFFEIYIDKLKFIFGVVTYLFKYSDTWWYKRVVPFCSDIYGSMKAKFFRRTLCGCINFQALSILTKNLKQDDREKYSILWADKIDLSYEKKCKDFSTKIYKLSKRHHITPYMCITINIYHNHR